MRSAFERLLKRRFARPLLVVVAFVAIVDFFWTTFQLHNYVYGSAGLTISKPDNRPWHPIDDLTHQATIQFETLLRKETTNISAAAQAYRARRGRQPPPGFDLWFRFAQKHKALIVEDFFDQIYDDLNPFWGVLAGEIRGFASGFRHRITVRNGKATKHTDDVERPWPDLWTDLVDSIANDLPDLDLAFNVMDESRVIVPWGKVNHYMDGARATTWAVSQGDLIDDVQSLASLNESHGSDGGFEGVGKYWAKVRRGCPPDSKARAVDGDVMQDFSSLPHLSGDHPAGSYHGYVQNWTLAKSPCDNPHLQGLHGSFVEPVSQSTTAKLLPIFSGSKLPVNNDILLPPAMYWTKNRWYSGGDSHGPRWSRKKDGVFWRGAASGGRNTKDNWSRFQRHRFVSMVNGSKVYDAEIDPKTSLSFVLPDKKAFNLSTQQPSSIKGDISRWVDHWCDVAFTSLNCFPYSKEAGDNCPYTTPYFRISKPVSMSNQYKYKYLPDIDGNSFSGRYRAFLASTSLPVKATVYNEWHDSRLLAWKHFVPMDNTFIDFYGIMDYFLGNQGVEGHDDVAMRLALEGKKWAERVLRREDMQIYVLRLLLEYARLCDDQRELLGWKEEALVNN